MSVQIETLPHMIAMLIKSMRETKEDFLKMSPFQGVGPNQKAWIAALRSGEFKQNRCRLEDNGQFCCLGVGCKLAQAEGVQVSTSAFGLLIGFTLIGDCDVIEWLGLRDYAGQADASLMDRPSGIATLTNMNDIGCTFLQIADILEEFPERFFKESK